MDLTVCPSTTELAPPRHSRCSIAFFSPKVIVCWIFGHQAKKWLHCIKPCQMKKWDWNTLQRVWVDSFSILILTHKMVVIAVHNWGLVSPTCLHTGSKNVWSEPQIIC
jgi:hypothetical protein